MRQSTILVVDDDAAIIRVLARVLTAEGVRFAGVSLDVAARLAEREGRSIALTAREADLLALLLRNGGRVTTREHALAQVWGDEAAATANVVDRYVTNLRRKLGDPILI